MKMPLARLEKDVVTNLDVPERTEERITMPGNDDVPRVTRQGRVLEMAGAALQRLRIRAVQDHRRQLQAWNRKRGDSIADGGWHMSRWLVEWHLLR